MAPRGRRPKPTHLRLVEGTHRPDRHGDVTEARRQVDESRSHFGPMEQPRFLKGRALAAWKQYIAPVTWLDGSREPAAIAFCELYAEFRQAPARFPASKHTQMRAYMGELGLTDDRARSGGPAKPRDEFFDD